MNARMTSKLLLEGLQSVADGAGGRTETWVALGTVWGEVTPRSGRETLGEAGQVSTQGFRIKVRAVPVGHTARPLPEQRFRFGVRVFRINAVTEADAGARYLICTCDEELAS